jgi:superfamily II DNA or RNA helicase
MAYMFDIKSVDKTTLKILKQKSVLKIQSKGSYYQSEESVKITRLEKEDDSFIAYIPFSMGIDYFKFRFLPLRIDLVQLECKFLGSLRDKQIECKRDAISSLEKTHAVTLSCYTGFGKTITSLALAHKIGLKTLICVTRLVLLNQWKDQILKHCPSTNECISSCSIIKPTDYSGATECNFGIINARNIEKIDSNVLKSFGTVIIDEVHLVLSKKTFKGLLHLIPRYIIALSATSYRNDGLDALFPLFFGQEKIVYKLSRYHIIYRVNTNFIPKPEYDIKGKINWNSILQAQAENVERNMLICDIVSRFSDRTFLILVKRIKQGESLYYMLQQRNENVATLFGIQQDFERNCRILIGTSSKIGTGFDFAKLDTLLLGSDLVEYYIQFLGRIMRTSGIPIVFDLVDKHNILVKHWNTRKKIYLDHGGTIQQFND